MQQILYKKPKSVKKLRPENDPKAKDVRTYWAMHLVRHSNSAGQPVWTGYVSTDELGQEGEQHNHSYVLYSTAASPKVHRLCDTETVEDAELIARLVNDDERRRSRDRIRNVEKTKKRRAQRAASIAS